MEFMVISALKFLSLPNILSVDHYLFKILATF